MQGFRSVAARLGLKDLPVAGREPARSIFTAASSKGVTEIMGAVGLSPYSTTQTQDLSETSPVTKGCLMYSGGVCQLSDHNLERSNTFFAKQPIVQKVSQHGLIIPRTGKEYIAGDGGRNFIWNTLLLPHLLHANKISAKGLFEDENIVIIRKLNALAFREINTAQKDDLTDAEMGEGITEALSWIKKKTLDSLGIEIQDLPLELQKLFGYMFESPVDIQKILTDVSMLPKESRGILVMRMYGFVRKLLSRAIVNCNKPFKDNDSLETRLAEALKIYASNDPNAIDIARVRTFYEKLPYTHTNAACKGDIWTTTVNEPNCFLQPFLGKMGKNKAANRPADGKGIMHVHCNVVCHWMDEEIILMIKQVAAREGLIIPDHCLGDVLDLLQYEFPEFLQVAVTLFKAFGWLPHLDLWSLFSGPRCFPK